MAALNKNTLVRVISEIEEDILELETERLGLTPEDIIELSVIGSELKKLRLTKMVLDSLNDILNDRRINKRKKNKRREK